MPSTEIGTAWTLVTGPVLEPVSLDEIKSHLRVTDNASDDVLDAYLIAAREEAEAYMARGLLTQTWKLVLAEFATEISLPMAAPLQSITSVKYYDTAGVLQTLASTYYDTDTVSRPGRVVLKPDQSWPSVQSDRRNGRVEITYVVGWTSPLLVPERIKQGIRQFVTYLDLDRDGLEPRALEARAAAERCWADRIWWTDPCW